MEEKIKSIALAINKLIEDGVSDINSNDKKYENLYNDIKSEIESDIKNTQELYDDYKLNKLDFNLIELEGYLRCLKTIMNKLDYLEKIHFTI